MSTPEDDYTMADIEEPYDPDYDLAGVEVVEETEGVGE